MKGASPSQTGIDVQRCALKVKRKKNKKKKIFTLLVIMYGFTWEAHLH